MNWKIEYDNDTGPDDESFWEKWAVTDGVKIFECTKEEDAKWLCDLLITVTELPTQEGRGERSCNNCGNPICSQRVAPQKAKHHVCGQWEPIAGKVNSKDQNAVLTTQRNMAEIQLVSLFEAISGFTITEPEMTIGEFQKYLPKICKFAREAESESVQPIPPDKGERSCDKHICCNCLRWKRIRSNIGACLSLGILYKSMTFNNNSCQRWQPVPPDKVEGKTHYEWEQLARDYFEDHGDCFEDHAPNGACKGCQFLHEEDVPTEEKTHWCVLCEGKYRDEDCHLCPGVNPAIKSCHKQGKGKVKK